MGGNTPVNCAIILAFLAFGSVQAISSYEKCLNCFYTNRTMAYYCQSS